MLLLGSSGGVMSSFKVVSCSSDRTVVMYHVHAGKLILRLSLSTTLESIAMNPMEDMLFVGGSNGSIFVIDMTITSFGISAANATVGFPLSTSNGLSGLNTDRFNRSNKSIDSSSKLTNTVELSSFSGKLTSNGSTTHSSLPKGVNIMTGHTRSVTSLACSRDNIRLVSVAEDGSLRVWDMWTKQCLREIKPLNKTALTNVMVRKLISQIN